MRRRTPLLLLPLFCLFSSLSPAAERIPLDADWKFTKGDPGSAASPAFDDASWESLSVPHDWSIAGPFDKANPSRGAGGFLPNGVAWYRKMLPAIPKDKRVYVEFDGIQSNATVYLNGEELGHRPNGYVPHFYDLTPHLNADRNVLAVRADTSKQPASRWYAGSGINRHVRLLVADVLHLQHQATVVTTPKFDKNSGTFHIQTTVNNDSTTPRRFTVMATIGGPPDSAPDGSYAVANESAPQTLNPGQSVDVSVDVQMPWGPWLWDIDNPQLHHALVRVIVDGKPVDAESIPFGVRTFEFRADTGFWINGRNVKLKGVCLHEDASALGTAVPKSAWRRHLSTLKSLGVNAIRPSHNPFSPDFLDLCDQMGFVVMDEIFDVWTVGKEDYDYHLYFKEWHLKDLETIVRRNRNHPSIVLYSAGNEIHDTPKPQIAIPILESLVAAYHKHDPTRPVTQALFRPNVSKDYDNGLADLLDVIGTNYRDTELLAAYAAKPTRKIVMTESGHDRKNWLTLRDNLPLSGTFLWTGIDYLGEARNWPTVAAGSGLIDRTGHIKPMGHERASWWSDKPMVFACRRTAPPPRTPSDPGFESLRRPQTQFPDWTPSDLAEHEETVDVYSNCDQVELLLSGQSLGSKPINKDAAPRTWKIPFQPGTLIARASNGDKVVATHQLRTAGKPAKILLTAERQTLPHSWEEVAYISATIVDDKDTPVPTANHEITFKVTGPADIIATDSADNASHESFHSPTRKAYQSRCIALLRASAPSGEIQVTATAPDLTSNTVTLTATKENP